MQHMPTDISNRSLLNSSSMDPPSVSPQPEDNSAPECSSWKLSLSEGTFLTFLLLFSSCVLLSLVANGSLVFLTARYRKLLWQPHYILVSNFSFCGVGLSICTAVPVLWSVASGQTPIYNCWCVTQFCTLRFFFLTSQTVLALMAAERYIFICHSIHYLRLVNTRNMHLSMGLMWLLSTVLSLHAGLVLVQGQSERTAQQHTNGLLCDAFAIMEYISISRWKQVQVFGPPTAIVVLCIFSICYCYGCMYHTAFKVSVVLKLSTRRVNRTMGCYILMFLLPLAMHLAFVGLAMSRRHGTDPCKSLDFTITPFLIVIPTCINAFFLLSRSPRTRSLLHPWCVSQVEVLQEAPELHGTWEDTQQEEVLERMERLEMSAYLPGCVQSEPGERQVTEVDCGYCENYAWHHCV